MEEEWEGQEMLKMRAQQMVTTGAEVEGKEDRENEQVYVTLTLRELSTTYIMREQSSSTRVQLFSITLVDHTHTG